VADVTAAAVSPHIKRTLARATVAGLAAALLVAGGGRVLERLRFGATDQAAVARVQSEVARRFDDTAAALGALAARVDQPRVLQAATDPAALKDVFGSLDAAVRDTPDVDAGITVYDPAAAPVAWAGRVSDWPLERIAGPAALFVAPAALGPRLVRVEPIAGGDASPARRGTIVSERGIGAVSAAPGFRDRFVLQTSTVPVTLEVRVQYPATYSSPYFFQIASPQGHTLVEAFVDPNELAAARSRWRRATAALALVVLAIAVLVAAAPLLEIRRHARSAPTVVRATIGVIALLLIGRLLLAAATTRVDGFLPFAVWADVLLSALLIVALVWISLDLVERRRVGQPRRPLVERSGAARNRSLAAHLGAGAAAGFILWTYERFLQNVVSRTAIDLLQFSLHPWDLPRIGLAFGLVLLHAGVIWITVLLLRLAYTTWRLPRHGRQRWAAAAAWLAGVAAAAAIAVRINGGVPLWPFVGAAAVAGACGIAFATAQRVARRASQAARLFALYLALLVPAVALYPSLHALATQRKEQLVAQEFAPQAALLRDDLQDALSRARESLDAIPSLATFITAPADEGPTTEQAFELWRLTELGNRRLTSAVELYGPDGGLVSRFALLLPDYSTARHERVDCDWDLFEEVSPFGSSERHVLRASRGICDNRRQLGAIVIRAMLDYRTLPFISSRSPYLESLRPERDTRHNPGSDVEFVVYGWSRAPLYVSGTEVWPLSNTVFDRMVASREPLWETVRRDNETFRVYFFNDRGGIYALGYPVITAFGHLVNLAELVTLVFAVFLLLIAGATLLNAVTSATPASGRALLREVRSSFYRKLFLAFVAVAVVPVLILAVAAHTYFAGQFQREIEETAVDTATVAQRLVEDYVTVAQRLATDAGLPQSGPVADLPDDQIMVLVGRAIDQAVHFFSGNRLQATSERDLFESGLLPKRTPADVYEHIVLDRLPTHAGEEQVGSLRYLVAAAPVRASEANGIVTVPQTLREADLERQIDELDRRILLGFVLFVLLGAGLGYWMAERIADPVSRLTRATRRIARGDLDARVAATSSDELRRLVEDFNRMAADLKRQRSELERTQRLEAWADMARQVAHDIKNPLTPIQLSAEHARRVNIDRGRPLSPALDECVTAILTQVKLLRQISTEFSSFASSPTPRPEPTDVAELAQSVVEPYRTGLAGRIAVTVEAEAGLPRLSIDRTLFARALTNVIENALHAMPGAGELTVAVRRPVPVPNAQGPLAEAVVVEITDTGVGMDQDALGRIFEPYFSTKATGTGLGLTIAKRNVELNGGSISVRSERGMGTVVTLTLYSMPNASSTLPRLPPH
jgi:nitrogen fixation/metabolism regulation signal transduction histidine kinase